MKLKIVRLREGFEALVAYNEVDFDSPDHLSIGVNKIILNPSKDESFVPILPGVAYGWLFAPNCRKVPMLVSEYYDVPTATVSIGFSSNTGSCQGFQVASVEELRKILEERYSGTTTSLLITDPSNSNYVGQFFDRVVTRLLDENYTDPRVINPASALVLCGDDIRKGFSIISMNWPELIDTASKQTVSDVITEKDKPNNIYISSAVLNNVHDKLSDDITQFSKFKKNMIFRAMLCFNNNPVAYHQKDGQNAAGYYL